MVLDQAWSFIQECRVLIINMAPGRKKEKRLLWSIDKNKRECDGDRQPHNEAYAELSLIEKETMEGG